MIKFKDDFILSVHIVILSGTPFAIPTAKQTIPTAKQNKGRKYAYTPLSKYGYRLGGQTAITFEVKACNDAHIGLMPSTRDAGAIYEIVIGGWSNRKSVIRRSKQGRVQTQAGGKYLSCKEYKVFR